MDGSIVLIATATLVIITLLTIVTIDEKREQQMNAQKAQELREAIQAQAAAQAARINLIEDIAAKYGENYEAEHNIRLAAEDNFQIYIDNQVVDSIEEIEEVINAKYARIEAIKAKYTTQYPSVVGIYFTDTSDENNVQADVTVGEELLHPNETLAATIADAEARVEEEFRMHFNKFTAEELIAISFAYKDKVKTLSDILALYYEAKEPAARERWEIQCELEALNHEQYNGGGITNVNKLKTMYKGFVKALRTQAEKLGYSVDITEGNTYVTNVAARNGISHVQRVAALRLKWDLSVGEVTFKVIKDLEEESRYIVDVDGFGEAEACLKIDDDDAVAIQSLSPVDREAYFEENEVMDSLWKDDLHATIPQLLQVI